MRRSDLHRTVWLLLAGFLSLQPLQAQRVVFAHFMLVNQNDVRFDAPSEDVIASYQRQIRDAQAIGIDGFALNAGGWFKEPHYIRQASEMFEAAYRLHSHFKLIFSADMCCSNGLEDVEDMMRRFANHPRYADVYYRQNGKFLLTTFAGTSKGPDFWQAVRHDLETGANPSTRPAPDAPLAAEIPSSKPLPIALVPAFFWGGELPDQAQVATGLSEYAKLIDGALYWGIAGVPDLGHTPDQLPSSLAYASQLHAAGKLYMAPICFQFWGANAGRYYEYSGYEGMRAMWMSAIKTTHPELVEIITWNDFIEGSYINRIRDPAAYPESNDLGASVLPVSTRNYFHTHTGAADLMAYFIQWYKTGVQPTLSHDTVFWAYRTVANLEPQGAPKLKLYGPVRQVVYVTANLTHPAQLKVSFGTASKLVSLPAGSTDVQVPMLAGQKPRFELMRDGRQVVAASGADEIVVDAAYRNLYYSTGSMQD